jgi:hypothetical protein
MSGDDGETEGEGGRKNLWLPIKRAEKAMMMMRRRKKGHQFTKSNSLNLDFLSAIWSPLSTHHLTLKFSRITLTSKLSERLLFLSKKLLEGNRNWMFCSCELAYQNPYHLNLAPLSKWCQSLARTDNKHGRGTKFSLF